MLHNKIPCSSKFSDEPEKIQHFSFYLKIMKTLIMKLLFNSMA